MRIISLEAENFKILRAVQIAPEGHMVTIGGKNGQGKSSVLDALWVALQGKAVAPVKPIRAGEEKCRIVVTLGDDDAELIVTRTFTDKGEGRMTDTFKVESGDGKTAFKSPQSVLDELMGAIGFDPLEFVQRKPEDQAAMLLGLVPLPIDLEQMAEDDRTDFQARTIVNRQIASLKAQIDAIVVPDDLPADAPDRDALADQLAEAGETNAAIERERADRWRMGELIDQARANAEAQRANAKDARDQAAELIKRAEAFEESAKKYDEAAEKQAADLGALPPVAEPIDTAAVRAKMQEAEAVLGAIARRDQRARLMAELEAEQKAAETLTSAMAERETQRRDALAKAKMPIEGLGFAVNEKGKPVVLMNGQPFDQASSAEQIKASTAIAMAANPELRVLRIKDGSLLDEDAMAAIAQMAEDEDFQLWVERVGTGGVGIVIENGQIKGAPEVEPKSPAEPAPDAKPKGKSKPKAAEPDKPEGSLL